MQTVILVDGTKIDTEQDLVIVANGLKAVTIHCTKNCEWYVPTDKIVCIKKDLKPKPVPPEPPVKEGEETETPEEGTEEGTTEEEVIEGEEPIEEGEIVDGE